MCFPILSFRACKSTGVILMGVHVNFQFYRTSEVDKNRQILRYDQTELALVSMQVSANLFPHLHRYLLYFQEAPCSQLNVNHTKIFFTEKRRQFSIKHFVSMQMFSKIRQVPIPTIPLDRNESELPTYMQYNNMQVSRKRFHFVLILNYD